MLAVLPDALRTRNVQLVRDFERRYERVGIPALIVQILTGFWLAHRYIPGVLDTFHFADRIQSIIAIKLVLLLATAITGAHARIWIIPNLTPERMNGLAVHIGLVTVFAVALLILGASLSFAG